MEDKDTIKPTTIRIDEEARERLKGISKAEGWSQNETMNKLISIYEIEQAKIIIPNRKTEIETMETHLQSISEIYRASLQLNQDAEERIRSGYSNTLESNQKTIVDLQKKNEELKNLAEDMQASASNYLEKSDSLEKDNATLQANIKKTEELCEQYKEKNDTLNGLIVEYKQYADDNKLLADKVDTLGKENDKVKSLYESELLKLKKDYEMQLLDKEKEIDSIKNECSNKLLELREEHSDKIENLKSKHNDEIEKSNVDYKNILTELEQLRKDNYKLKEELLKKPEVTEPVAKKKTTKKKENIVSPNK